MLTHLMLMRHAKSSWDTPDQSDHARPLNKRGRKSAEAIGMALHAKGLAPDLIWSSDAERTRETALRLIRVIPGPQKVVYGAEFYHASAEEAITQCQKCGEPAVDKLMLLGHNPGWATLYEYYSGQYEAFPTGSCAIFERIPGDKNWLSNKSWRLIDFLRPRDLFT